MKITSIFLLLLIGLTNLTAQNKHNAIFYTENGENFWIILNGIRQNKDAETNVKITDLNAPNYRVKVIFEDKNLGEVSKNIYTGEYSEESTYRIKKNKKGEYVIRFFSEVPLTEAESNYTDGETITFSTDQQYSEDPFVQTTVTTTTTTTTTGTNTPESGGSVSINAGSDEFGINVNVNDTDLDDYNETGTSSSSDNISGSVNVNVGGDEFGLNININGTGTTEYNETTTVTSSTTTTTTTTTSNYSEPDHYVMNGYNGTIGCPWPMEESDFNQAKQTISSKDFEDSKLQIAKQIVSSNCLFADQVKEIMALFTFEESRIDFAKFSYKRTYDQENYFKVYDAFEFELSIDELTQFINSQ